MTAPVSVVMVGVGGYGAWYLDALDRLTPDRVELTAAVDPFPLRSRAATALAARGVPVFASLEESLGTRSGVELVIIASPIHHHVPQCLSALAHGCHVLCDKPVGPTVQEVGELIRARDASNRWVRIGYQWSYSDGIQALKRDIRAGRFGAPIRLKTCCLWPRTVSYYRRNDWAGRLRDAATGRWVLDSPLNNAQAHFLHNLFFLLGSESASSAMPVDVTAEVCRVNGIESYDTVACRARTAEGVELFFYGSHASRDSWGPRFDLEFEEACVRYEARAEGDNAGEIVVEAGGGQVGVYPSPDANDQFLKLAEAVEAVRTPRAVVCGPEAASAQTVCANGVLESVGEIPTVPNDIRRREAEPDRYWIDGLDDDFRRCYERALLPSEAGVSWAVTGRTVDLGGYDRFPSAERRA